MSWLFVNAAWQVIIINLLGGVLWEAFSLASLNYLLSSFPEEQRARYSALYQMVVTLTFAGGATLGSLVISQLGIKGVFLVSAIGRNIASLTFARFVRSAQYREQVLNPPQIF